MSRKITRRALLGWSLVTMGGTALAACAIPASQPAEGPAASGGDSAAPASKPPINISMVEMIWGVPQDTAVLDRVAGPYQQKGAGRRGEHQVQIDPARRPPRTVSGVVRVRRKVHLCL